MDIGAEFLNTKAPSNVKSTSFHVTVFYSQMRKSCTRKQIQKWAFQRRGAQDDKDGPAISRYMTVSKLFVGNVWHLQRHWGTPSLCEKQGNTECGGDPAAKGAVSLSTMVKTVFMVHRIAKESDMIWPPSANEFYTYVLMNNANLVIWTQNNIKSSWLVRVSLISGVNEQKS